MVAYGKCKCGLTPSRRVAVSLQERMQKLKAAMGKLDEDKKQLRLGLDDAENRVTKGELNRRSLEGELQRMRLSLTDKETENQVRCGCDGNVRC